MRRNVALDLEFTEITKKKGNVAFNMEIIQIGAIMMDEQMKYISEFKCFVRPEYCRITKHCTKITGIKQAQVDNAAPFSKCISDFLIWIGDDYKDTYIYSWSNSDLIQLQSECAAKNINSVRLNKLFENWIDFQRYFGDLLGYTWQMSLKNALSAMDMEFEGKPHDALNDAKSTANLIQLAYDESAFDKKASALKFFFRKEEEDILTIGDIIPKDILLAS